jgi:hypothetical protein
MQRGDAADALKKQQNAALNLANRARKGAAFLLLSFAMYETERYHRFRIRTADLHGWLWALRGLWRRKRVETECRAGLAHVAVHLVHIQDVTLN